MVRVVTNHIMVIELKVVVKATTFFYYVLYKNQNLARIIHDRIFCRHGSWLWFVVMVRVVTNHIFKLTCPKIGLHKKCKIWKYKFSLFREEITV